MPATDDIGQCTALFRTDLQAAWMGKSLGRRARTVKRQEMAAVCVPIQVTRLSRRVPIIVTTHVETVVLLKRDVP